MNANYNLHVVIIYNPPNIIAFNGSNNSIIKVKVKKMTKKISRENFLENYLIF